MILPKANGGLKVPDWDSQVGAIQAQWVLRYLSPEARPWKPLLDYYLSAGAGPRGRAELLSCLPLAPILARLTPDEVPSTDPDSDEPDRSLRARKAGSHPILSFWRTAISQFRALKWEESSDRIDSHALSESMFDSASRARPAGVKWISFWKNACGIHHFRDLINADTGAFYTPLEMHQTGQPQLRK